jgi:GNAT superfamily N-acetyltransferase
MHIRSPLLKDRKCLEELLAAPNGNPFRQEEVECAMELLHAVLVPPSGNTYEGLVGVNEADEPITYACFGATPMTEGTFDVYWMVTSFSLRGTGLGAKLLSSLESRLSARGACSIRIETSSLEGQGGARRFYERCGYKLVGVIPDFYRRGDDLVTLVKRLSQ